MCKKYSASVKTKRPFDVGNGYYIVDKCSATVEPLIVGGNDTAAKEYPHMVTITLRYTPVHFHVEII